MLFRSKSNGRPAALAEISEDPGLRTALEAIVQRVNAKLAPAERVRRFILAREPFSVANELMTPTLKVKRHKVREIYGQKLDALYREQAR